MHIHRLLQSRAIGEVQGYRCQLNLGVPPPEQQGWRSATEAFEGGWALDVGVHAIRALRMWFGAVVTTDEHERQGTAEAPAHRGLGMNGWSEEAEGWLEHEGGMRGFVRFRFFEEAPHGSAARRKAARKQGVGAQEEPPAETGKDTCGGGGGLPLDSVSAAANEASTGDETAEEHKVRIYGTLGCLMWDMDENSVLVTLADENQKEEEKDQCLERHTSL